MSVEPLTTSQVQELARHLRLVLSQFKRRLYQESPPGDLSPPQLAVLRHLMAAESATISGLARLEGIRPQSMGSTVTGLEARGLLASLPDPTDRRQRLYALTPEAHELIDALHSSREDWLARAIAHQLSATEQATLSEALTLLERLNRA